MELIPLLTKIQPYFSKKYFIVCGLIILAPWLMVAIAGLINSLSGGGRLDTGGSNNSVAYSIMVLSIAVGAICIMIGGSLIVVGAIVRLLGRFFL